MSPFELSKKKRTPHGRVRLVVAAIVLGLGASSPAPGAEPERVGPLSLPGVDGRPATVRFEDARVTLVNFWATWCLPCRKEMPRLDKLFRDYRPKGLQVVGVAVQSGEPPLVKEFLEENIGVSYTILVGDIDVMERFGEAEIVPTTYLVGPDGGILTRHYGVTQDFEAQIEAEILARLGGPAPEPPAEERPQVPKAPLTAADRRVLDALIEDWSLPEHFSPVDLVMRNLGIAPAPAARVRLGRHILDAEDLHPALDKFGPVSVVLSKEEKMVVTALLRREKDGAPIPTMQELAVMTGARTGEIPVSLEILEELGFLEPSSGGPGVGMRVSRGLAGTAEPIDLAATIVAEPSAKPFSVASLPRYLSALVAAPPEGRVTIDGLCSHCVSKVQVVMEKGQVVLPTSAVLLLGGGGYDALFLSPAHLQEWFREHAEMKDLPHEELGRFVQTLHDQPVVATSGAVRLSTRASR